MNSAIDHIMTHGHTPKNSVIGKSKLQGTLVYKDTFRNMLYKPFNIKAVNSPSGFMVSLADILTLASKGNEETESNMYVPHQWVHECTWPHNDKVMINHSKNQE